MFLLAIKYMGGKLMALSSITPGYGFGILTNERIIVLSMLIDLIIALLSIFAAVLTLYSKLK